MCKVLEKKIDRHLQPHRKLDRIQLNTHTHTTCIAYMFPNYSQRLKFLHPSRHFRPIPRPHTLSQTTPITGYLMVNGCFAPNVEGRRFWLSARWNTRISSPPHSPTRVDVFFHDLVLADRNTTRQHEVSRCIPTLPHHGCVSQLLPELR